LIILIITGAGVGTYVVTRLVGESNQVFSSNEVSNQTAVARVGDLTMSATGSGQIIPAEEKSLSFQESGVLVELLVKVGDQVKAGDVLARLQTDKTPTQLAADIAGAELDLITAQQKLNDLYENAETETAKALITLENAQKALEALQNVELEETQALQAIVEAKEAIENAEMQAYILNSSPSQDAFYTAYASILFKEKKLTETQKKIEKTEHEIKTAQLDIIRDQLEQQLLNLKVKLAEQQIEYENAVYKYNTMDDPPDPLKLSVAEAQLVTALTQLEEAQQEWEDIQAGPDPGEVAQAEAALAEAQLDWERLRDGPDPEEISIAEAELAAAQAKLSLAQQEQAVVELVAPTGGTVLSVNAVEGEFNGTGMILTLADLSQPVLEVYLDETDLDKVGRGYQVEVTFDALPNDHFTGYIEAVDPGLVEVSRVPAVRVLVNLDMSSYGKSQTLPVGLTATVDVIAGRATNAVLVPVEALHELSPGEFAVYMLKNGSYELQRVSVGLKDFTSAEILDGLTAGDTVAIGNIENVGNQP
jgi:HlyD family secretion protein